MKTQRDIASFVLRFTQDLWQDPYGEPRVQWRGHIRHIQGDEETHFTGLAEALSFIQQKLVKHTLDVLEALPGDVEMDQQKTLRESFKLWEDLTSSYTNLMFDVAQRTIEQSDAFQAQVGEMMRAALQTWPHPSQADQAKLTARLEALQAQMQTLAQQVAAMEKAQRKGQEL
jgi:DNA anti-recombination protein RmuC